MVISMIKFSMATLCSGIHELVLLVYFMCICSHGNTLWLDVIEERVELKDVAVVTPVSSLKGKLLQLGLAEANIGHLAQLKQATSDISNSASIIKPR